MPPALASKFTVSELAVLRIVGDEVRERGCCDRTVDEIAARAGTCRTVVKDAIRTAATLGLLTVQERRRQGQKNLPNVVRIVSREWTQWLARGPKSGRPMVPKPIGVGNFTPTDSRQRKEGAAYRPQGLSMKKVPATHGSNRSRPAWDNSKRERWCQRAQVISDTNTARRRAARKSQDHKSQDPLGKFSQDG